MIKGATLAQPWKKSRLRITSPSTISPPTMKRMELNPRYQGVLIHHCPGAHFTFHNYDHGLCNSHLLRELIYLHEEPDQSWAAIMIELLLEAKDPTDRELSRESGSRRVIGKGRVFPPC